MLSPYSSQTLAILVKLLPDLAGLVSERDEVFQVELLTPTGWEFWLSSEEEDYLTVGFAEYHCHFGNFQGTRGSTRVGTESIGRPLGLLKRGFMSQ